MSEAIPVALFAYSRVDCLKQTLDCLRANGVPKIYAFSDAARNPSHAQGVREVRELLRSVDWCEMVITERRTNLGLGKSLVLGITETLDKHEALLVFEDDHVIVPGAYAWLSSALEHYRDAPEVMSVTGWTHPLVTPKNTGDQPYLDGRAECWVWGTWRRAWQGVEATDAATLVKECKARDIWPRKYGDDLAQMAAEEQSKNIWAVRWLYWHILKGGLCVRPPHSMVEHIGVGADSTNAGADNGIWQNPPLKPCPPIPAKWPGPVEHPDCVKLWRKACKTPPQPEPSWWDKITATLRKGASQAPAEPEPQVLFSGSHPSWEAALAACGDTAAPSAMLDRERTAALRSRSAHTHHEGGALNEAAPPWPVLATLLRASAKSGLNLRVLETGGLLGGTYFLCRSFLAGAGLRQWNVIEQPEFATAGSDEFADEVLTFSSTLAQDPGAASKHNALIISNAARQSTPHQLLDAVLALRVPVVIVDLTPFWDEADRADQLTVKTVAPRTYPLRSPSWFFNQRAFLARFEHDYKIVAAFESPEILRVDDKKRARNRGFIFELKTVPS